MIRLRIAPVLFAGADFSPYRDARPESSRPPVESREVVGVVTSEEHIDVYWVHDNELVAQGHSTLYRTRVGVDGASRLSITRVHQFNDRVGVRVSGSGENVQVLWSADSQFMASPVEGDALKYPDGKAVGAGLYADLQCHRAECVAVYDMGGRKMAVIVDSDSNVISGPFALPDGFEPRAVRFGESGIFFVRHTMNELRAAMVERDGNVRYDVRLASAEPAAFHAMQPGVTTTGDDEYVVVFAEFTTEPDELHAITIASDGSVSAPTPLMQTEDHADLPSNIGGISLASNARSFLLGGRHVIGPSFLLQLDAALQPTGTVARADAIPSVHPHSNGRDFIVVWQGDLPYVTIVHEDGSSTASLALVAFARRRAVR